MPNNSIKFGIDLLPNSDQTYNLGLVDATTSTSLRWNIFGDVTGSLTGNADTATVASKLTTNDLGNVTKPIYLDDGTAKACNDYAGGTAVTLNEANKSADTTSFYAPTAVGTQYQILVSGGNTNKEPTWTAAATLQSDTSKDANTAAYTTLTLGNSGNVSTTTAHSEGQITLYSATTGSHTINGASAATAYTHTLPTQTGWIVSGAVAGVASNTTLMYLANTGILTASTANVGSSVQPVYLASGVITAIEFTSNRLYYASDTDSFSAGTYYANGTGLAINQTSLTNGYTLEVNGNIGVHGDIVPLNAGKTLGTANTAEENEDDNGKRWAHVYIGDADTHGNVYAPIYWNNGTPAVADSAIQYMAFTIPANSQTLSIQHEAYTDATQVLQIVVDTSSQKYLNSPITWTSSVGAITLTLTSNSYAAISGYIITARGANITPPSNT